MEMTLSRRIVVLAVTMLVALMMVAVPALAAPGKNGRGAANANPNASFGIATAIANSGSDDCSLCNPV